MPILDRSRLVQGRCDYGGTTSELFFISMAARLLGMHPQTLRKYERLGLVRPTRTIGSMRLYSREEIERLRLIKHLVDESGSTWRACSGCCRSPKCVARLRPLAATRAARRGTTRAADCCASWSG